MVDVEELQRRVKLDPMNVEAQIELVSTRARIEGPLVYLECLADRLLWNKTSEFLQHRAIEEVGSRLDGYVLKDVRVWECDVNLRDARLKSHPNIISHRLGTFTHLVTGIDFNLIPGRLGTIGDARSKEIFVNTGSWNIKPLLIARHPITNEQANKLFRKDGGTVWSGSNGKDLPHTGSIHSSAVEHLKDHDMRLPDPEEWKWALAAGTDTRFYWGDRFDPSHVWYEGNSRGNIVRAFLPESKPSDVGRFVTVHFGIANMSRPGDDVHGHIHRVIGGGQIEVSLSLEQAQRYGERRPHDPCEHDLLGKYNAYGLVDMIGNVWEWLRDRTITGESFQSYEHSVKNLQWGNLDFSELDNSDIEQVGIRPAVTVPGIG